MRKLPLLLFVLIGAHAMAATGDDIAKRLDAIRQHLPACHEKIEQLRARGEDPSYPLCTYSALYHFTAVAKGDLSSAVPNNWGWREINDNKSGYTPTRD